MNRKSTKPKYSKLRLIKTFQYFQLDPVVEQSEAENFGAYIYVDHNFDQVRLKLRQVYQPSFLFPYQYKEKL